MLYLEYSKRMYPTRNEKRLAGLAKRGIKGTQTRHFNHTCDGRQVLISESIGWLNC